MTRRGPEIEKSKRFERPVPRRDFLGIAAAWSALSAFTLAALGSLRLPMPAVFPESNPVVKLGPTERFKVGSASYFPEHRLWLFRDVAGFHALSSVCTHLGCIAKREDGGTFKCPCHGSRFDALGAVEGGPAPRGLAWIELTLSPEGLLVANTLQEVAVGTILAA